MLIADTSALLALYNEREPAHDEVRRVVEAEPEPLVVSPYVVAELDYLIATRIGVDAELAMLDELGGGAYHLAEISAEDLAVARSAVDRYRDQRIGVADASIVVLAARFATRSILTLDHRHFSVVRPQSGGRFRILP